MDIWYIETKETVIYVIYKSIRTVRNIFHSIQVTLTHAWNLVNNISYSPINYFCISARIYAIICSKPINFNTSWENVLSKTATGSKSLAILDVCITLNATHAGSWISHCIALDKKKIFHAFSVKKIKKIFREFSVKQRQM